MKKYQGQNITFNIRLDGKTVSDFESIIVYMYTDNCHVVKYAYPNKGGYSLLDITNNTLSGIIPESSTKNMLGTLMCDLLFDNSLKKVSTGIIIEGNLIKNEI